jgi:DNA-binding transcriptional LysR family regulator
MLEGIDALVALETFGTVSEAATRLRLTQSAVSKRIQSLQAQVGFRLVEPDGRRLRLTARAIDFLDRARPLLAELRGLVKPLVSDAPRSFSLALADSIASSWGPAVIRRVLSERRELDVDLHAHRSVLVIESVRLGRYDIGLCTESTAAKDLIQHPLVDEALVLVLGELGSKMDRTLPLISIESTSATWRAIAPLLRAHHPDLCAGEIVFVESFGAVLQMSRAGFGNGLLPLGLALDMKIARTSLRALPGVARRVSLLTRKSLHQQPAFLGFRDQLGRAVRQHFAEHGAGRLRPLR